MNTPKNILTQYALDHLSDQGAFERLALDLLYLLGNTEAIPMAPRGGADGGQDIKYRNPSNELSCTFVSLEKNGLSKFKKDAVKHKKGIYKEYSYFTTSYLTYQDKIKITQIALDDLGAVVHLYDIEVLRSLLDTNYQDLRSKYLDIPLEEVSKYLILSSDLKKYNADPLVQSSRELYEAKLADFSSRSHMANAIPISLPSIGVRSTSTILKNIRRYQAEVNDFSLSINDLYSFNLKILSDTYDENVEVHIRSDEGIRFSFKDSLLDVPSEPDLSEVLRVSPYGDMRELISSNLNLTGGRPDRSEFYTTIDDDGSVVSKINTINPNQPKELFDESVFFAKPKDAEKVQLILTIYSKHAKTSDFEYELDLSEAKILEFK